MSSVLTLIRPLSLPSSKFFHVHSFQFLKAITTGVAGIPLAPLSPRCPFFPGGSWTPGTPLAPSVPFTPAEPLTPEGPWDPVFPDPLSLHHGHACRESHHNRGEEIESLEQAINMLILNIC